MAQGFDDRIVRVGLQIGTQIKWYEGLFVTATGSKCANALQNECEVKITNLAAATRDYLLTEASPFRRRGTRKKFIVQAGRKSTGVSTVFVGDVVSATAAQPPDIAVTIRNKTADFDKGNVIARSQPGMASMQGIAGQVAGDLGLSLRFEAQDKQVANYSFTGGALRQVDHLGTHGDVDAYVDDDTLVVKPRGAALRGTGRLLNMDTGLIGIPEFTERGVKVKMLYDNQTRLGSGLIVQSKMNPAANGNYVVYKLDFELSNRDTPFYLVAEAQRV